MGVNKELNTPNIPDNVYTKLRYSEYLKHLNPNNSEDYNFTTGDIISCRGHFYTFQKIVNDVVHCYDRYGFSNYIKIEEIDGVIIRNDYPEFFL